MTFGSYVGIDYSGAETPESHLKALQMYAAKPQVSCQVLDPIAEALDDRQTRIFLESLVAG
jgi:hypothetical protein